MEVKESVKQEFFILTHDLVPISPILGEGSCIFICPLPKGYKEVIAKNLEEIDAVSKKIVVEINKQAGLRNPPFQNILLGYHERSEKEQKRLLKEHFKITEVSIDKRGVYGVQAGGDVNSGDIYLSSDVYPYHNYQLGLAHLFEPNTAFCCHNMDYYWQALLTREFCIRYFNWLNKKIFEKEKDN